MKRTGQGLSPEGHPSDRRPLWGSSINHHTLLCCSDNFRTICVLHSQYLVAWFYKVMYGVEHYQTAFENPHQLRPVIWLCRKMSTEVRRFDKQDVLYRSPICEIIICEQLSRYLTIWSFCSSYYWCCINGPVAIRHFLSPFLETGVT